MTYVTSCVLSSCSQTTMLRDFLAFVCVLRTLPTLNYMIPKSYFVRSNSHSLSLSLCRFAIRSFSLLLLHISDSHKFHTSQVSVSIFCSKLENTVQRDFPVKSNLAVWTSGCRSAAEQPLPLFHLLRRRYPVSCCLLQGEAICFVVGCDAV